jgi:hypothetical protein
MHVLPTGIAWMVSCASLFVLASMQSDLLQFGGVLCTAVQMLRTSVLYLAVYNGLEL